MTRDIRLSFDRVPEIYDRVRPSYPPSFFEELFSLVPATAQVLEVGPGTGQATRSLLAQRATVTAVEIGPNLAATLRENFADVHGLTVVNDAFEEADLPLGHFDAIVCATAYHWIEPEAQVARPIELLAPGGVVAIIDLIQVDSAVDQGYFKRVVPIYQAFGKAQRDWDPKTYDTARPKIADAFEASGRYASVRVARERWDQTYTTAQYRDLLLSYSGTQMMEEPERSSMVDQLVEVVEHEFAGSVTRPLVATLTLATTMQ